MTEFQALTVMIASCSLVTAIIFGVLTVVLSILNLTKKK